MVFAKFRNLLQLVLVTRFATRESWIRESDPFNFASARCVFSGIWSVPSRARFNRSIYRFAARNNSDLSDHRDHRLCAVIWRRGRTSHVPKMKFRLAFIASCRFDCIDFIGRPVIINGTNIRESKPAGGIVQYRFCANIVAGERGRDETGRNPAKRVKRTTHPLTHLITWKVLKCTAGLFTAMCKKFIRCKQHRNALRAIRSVIIDYDKAPFR